MSDSEKHKTTLEDIAKNLGVEIEKKVEEFKFSDKRFFNEIYKLEISAKILYEEMILKFGNLLGKDVERLKELVTKRDTQSS
ncbi:MAG: hypothetical protein QXX76_04680 [Archaeoglobaceae archaeon]